MRATVKIRTETKLEKEFEPRLKRNLEEAEKNYDRNFTSSLLGIERISSNFYGKIINQTNPEKILCT
jgi:hypothetical protein